MSDELIIKIGKYCRDFRILILDMSLKDFSDIRGLNNKNVNAFEYGRANNIKYLYHYYQMADTEQRILFTNQIFDLI